MKIYTKTGDEGNTALIGGVRVPKSHIRIDAYGTVDELNSHLGLLRDQSISQEYRDFIVTIQNNLFVIGAQLAAAPKSKMQLPELLPTHTLGLEQAIDGLDAQLPPLKTFVLPGGHSTVSMCHIARTVCRRAERLVVLLAQTDAVNPDILVYLNRLSDYLFTLARKLAQDLNVVEMPWIA